MEGPRSPTEKEYPRVLDFLNGHLRPATNWSLANEYPTALTLSNLNNIRIITEQEKVLAHAVLKPLIIKTPLAIFKVAAIGSVVTEESYRNQGLSRKILENCLEEAYLQECDVALLWTNIYDFYRKLDFELAGYEVSFVIDQEIPVEVQGLKFLKGAQVSAEAIYRLYSQHTVGSVRTAEDIRKFLQIPQSQIYTAWDTKGNLVAYAVEGKGADLTGYIHEWGGSVTHLMALLSHIRKEKKSSFTIIVPFHSQNLIQKLRTVSSTHNEGYLGMLKIVRHDSLFAKIKKAARTLGLNDLVLAKQDNGFVFGFGADVINIQDIKELTQLIFGPIPDVPYLKTETLEKMHRLLPLSLWAWGWDSI